jgi:hypothetical protein
MQNRTTLSMPGGPLLTLTLQLPFFEKGALSDRLVCSAPV